MSTQTNQLVQLVETSGLEKTKQNQIAETLGIFFNKASEWDATIQSIVITSPDEVGKMKMAKEGRLTLKNMRLEAEKVVKTKRDEVKFRMANDILEDKLWLKAGQMMEATFKNLETKLEEKEKFAERWKADQEEKLRAERTDLIQPYSDFLPYGLNFGTMTEEDFQKTFLGSKLQSEAKKAEDKRIEDERVAKEKAEAEERERMRRENERLKKEAEEKEKELADERAKAEADRKEVEEKARKEREEADKKHHEEKAKLEVEKAKLQAEIRAKEEAEEKEAEEKRAAELKVKIDAEKSAKAPKKEKLTKWVDGLVIDIPSGLEKDQVVIEITSKFDLFKNWAKKEIEKL